MKKKKTDYRETLQKFQIHTKDGKEKFLMEVADWYRALFPARFAFFKTMLKRLNEVSKNADGSYRTEDGKTVFVRIRVPQELMIFLQRWIPEFGRDSADLELLRKVWCDWAVGKDHRRRSRMLLIDKEFRRRHVETTSEQAAQAQAEAPPAPDPRVHRTRHRS